MRLRTLPLLFALTLGLALPRVATSEDKADAKKPDVKPIKALLITGGCCHNYDKQKKLLTDGISERAQVEWKIVHEGKGGGDTKTMVSIYKEKEWWKGYDVIVHDECFADVHDIPFIEGILAAHKAGVPAVNLHCAMHCYRPKDFMGWFEMLGLQSASHGPQKPIDVKYVDTDHAITKGLKDWTTINEELYNNIRVLDKAKPLATGTQGDAKAVVTWTNDYNGTRIFCTTLGHNDDTVGDARYLDLVTRGLLWSVDKLNADYMKPIKQPEKKEKGPEPTPAK